MVVPPVTQDHQYESHAPESRAGRYGQDTESRYEPTWRCPSPATPAADFERTRGKLELPRILGVAAGKLLLDMDFAGTLVRIAGFLEDNDLRYALVGGLALAAYGGTRTTLDLDLAVDGDGQDTVIGFMESLGFETLYRSSGYSNHVHPDEDWGRVDFVYVRGESRERIFAGSRLHELSRDLAVPVPRPEHLAAMKVLAMKNDPTRTFQELADIRLLLMAPGVDKEAVRAFFERHGLSERFNELEETF